MANSLKFFWYLAFSMRSGQAFNPLNPHLSRAYSIKYEYCKILNVNYSNAWIILMIFRPVLDINRVFQISK